MRSLVDKCPLNKRRLLMVLCCLLCAAPSDALRAENDAKNEQSVVREPVQIDRAHIRKLGTPRATLRTFFDAFKPNGDRDDAVLCLDMSDLPEEVQRAAGETYAMKLKGLLDRMWRVRYERVSDQSDGDDFRLDYHAIGLYGDERDDAARIVIAQNANALWQFTPGTVAAIDDLWKRWESRPALAGVTVTRPPIFTPLWLEQLFPSRFRKTTLLLADYQWICLLALIMVGFAVDLLVRFFLGRLTAAWMTIFRNGEKIEAERMLWKPVGLLSQACVWYFGTKLIGLPAFALSILLVALKLFTVVAAVWTAFRLTDLTTKYLARKAEHTATKFDDLLVQMVSKSLKAFVLCIGVLTAAQAFSLPIAGLVGGLGIGGMALALASKDAISNLFGSFTVLTDRPFEVGDWIVTSDAEGTVENVGFRSTRIRTFYNSVVTLPNSLLTSTVVDNMGARQFRRIKTTLGLQYNTTPAQIDAFCEGIRELIRRHPSTRKDYFHVYFNGFGDSTLDILLYCFLDCSDWGIELREKHRLYNDILRLAERLNVQFAFPTRTLHLYQEDHAEQNPEIKSPQEAGKKAAAFIAGPPLAPDRTPGPIEYRGSEAG
jgi:MscS family membrane protein